MNLIHRIKYTLSTYGNTIDVVAVGVIGQRGLAARLGLNNPHPRLSKYGIQSVITTRTNAAPCVHLSHIYTCHQRLPQHTLSGTGYFRRKRYGLGELVAIKALGSKLNMRGVAEMPRPLQYPIHPLV